MTKSIQDASRKARPILFSGPMIRALLEGRKTQTRRIAPVLLPGDKKYIHCASKKEWIAERVAQCPYGTTGDLLWVRECFSYEIVDRNGFMSPWYWADGNPTSGDFTKPKPSIHMFRCLSRLTLELMAVSVERLQDIATEDAVAEGIEPVLTGAGERCGWLDYEHAGAGTGYYLEAINSYDSLWESINGLGSWDANPWVWVLTFKVHQCNVDDLLKRQAA
jgi:hypothetical protein